MRRKDAPQWILGPGAIVVAGSALFAYAAVIGLGLEITLGTLAGIIVVALDVGYASRRTAKPAKVSLQGLCLGVLVGALVGTFVWAEMLRHDLDRAASTFDFVVAGNDDLLHPNHQDAVEFIDKAGELASLPAHPVGAHVEVRCRASWGPWRLVDGNFMDSRVVKQSQASGQSVPPACPRR
jgi:hypothetical protein